MLGGDVAGGIGRAFRKHRVGIEVLGCYINPIHPDPVTRAAGIACFKEHLRHAREFGCNLVALESGSVHPDYLPHPGNASPQAWDEIVQVLAELSAEAGRHGAVVGIEPVVGHVLGDAERTRTLLDLIDSPHLRVVFDPVNLLSPQNFMDSEVVTNHALELLGDRIDVVHLKDFLITPDGMQYVATGGGLYHPSGLFSWLARHRPGIAVLLEETRPEGLSGILHTLRQSVSPSLS